MTGAPPSEQVKWRLSQAIFPPNLKRIQHAVLEKKPKIAKTRKNAYKIANKIEAPPVEQINVKGSLLYYYPACQPYVIHLYVRHRDHYCTVR